MPAGESDKVFAGSIPAIYDAHLVPLIFQPYADNMASRAAGMGPSRILEIAAGTGVVTRALRASVPASVEIVATDLNPAMLERARARGTPAPVQWQQADAMQLPFPDASFDLVVCQFGVMFFPEKAAAFREARRVLSPRGRLLFNVWDRIETNDFADVVTTALAERYPDAPPRFLARTPHGYHERARIEADLSLGGFGKVLAFDTVTHSSRAASPEMVALAYCQGTPLRNELEALGSDAVQLATDVAARALASRFGTGPIEGRVCAHVVVV